MKVENDTVANIDSCLYKWEVKKPSSSEYEVVATSVATSYLFDEVGTYFVKAFAKPNECTLFIESSAITVTLYSPTIAGEISSVQTICYNSNPSLVTQSAAPKGGDGTFSYQWQVKTTGDWSYISGANDTSYQPGVLTQTTFYRLQYTNGCTSVYSNEVEVYVRKTLTAPVITSSSDTICYGFAPAILSISTLATCDVHDSLTYQWQVRTTDGWSDIEGATALTYQPDVITEAHQYRVIATSVMGCGQVISNVHTVNVYDKLQISTTSVTPLCYLSRGTICVSATGDGGSYAYQWQDSVAGVWNNVTNGNSQQYLTPSNIGGEYFYRCIVIPTLGCAPDTSATISVVVYDSIVPCEITLVGADTICYGFVPEAIEVTTPAIGGDGNFTYKWMRRPEGATNFSYITGATNTSYSPPALTKTTEYQLEVTNDCDVKYTNIVRIYVRDELKAPVLIEHLDTICYNTIPNPIVASSFAEGGDDDSFFYQWLYSEDGINFLEIPGETNTMYQPDSLVKKTYYKLRASSAKICGDILSNIVTIHVFDSLRISATNPDTICYMTSVLLNVVTTGGGNHFSYQWQEQSAGNWQNIVGATLVSYETEPRTDGTYYYRCVVSSNSCDQYSRISPVITVPVYEALNPGIISGTDSTCYGYAPAESLRVDVPASGVDGNYVYQWQIKENGKWKHIFGATGTSYQPEPLMVGTDFRLQVASKCDTLYTNNVFVRVNSLPEVQTITGPSIVCYNQHEIYSVEKLNPGYTYEWMIERGEGEITTEDLNATTIDVLWKTPSSNDSVILRVNNNITGCERELKFGVAICNEQAPDRTIIVRKPNSDILVCEESGDLVYQWGYTEKSSQKEFVIDDSNRRYVLLPHTFNDNTYEYWLTLRNSETSPCYSKSYYSSENNTLITPSGAKVSVPTLVQWRIPIVVQNPCGDQVLCSVYTLSGELLTKCDLGKDNYISTTLPIFLSSGMYIMRVSIGEYVESIKLIAE